MANVENFRLFGGNGEEVNQEPNENGNDKNDQTEVTFGFPILDETQNVVMKTFLLQFYHISMVCPSKTSIHSYLSLIIFLEVIIM